MDEYTKDLYTMMFSLQTLQNQGITIRETVYKSLDKLLLWNKESENSKYLELALLHMQAYANMGFALDEENNTIREILKKTGKTREDFFPKGYLLGKRIKLTKSQVRGMIGRWRPSRDSPMTIGELVDDIIRKVKNHEEGRYIYQYHRTDVTTKGDIEVYELDGKPMYRHLLDRLAEIKNRYNKSKSDSQTIDITVVTRYREILDYCACIPDCHAVISPDSEKGISYTIKAGIMAVQEQKKLKKSSEVTHHTAEKEEYYMFAVADQPYLKSQSVIKLIDRVLKNTGGKRLAFSLRCGDAVGNPCVFNSSLIPQLLSLEGDKGGRSVAKKHDCVYVDIADERELMDIDTYLIR